MNNGAGVDPEWLSETIGAIYDCVLAPDGWPAVLARIADRFAFRYGMLAVVQSSDFGHQIAAQHGFDAEWLEIGTRYTGDTYAMWGGAARVNTFPLDEPMLGSAVTPPEQYADFAVYRDILQPRGIIDAIVVCLAREAQLIGYLALNRVESDGPIGSGELEGLRLITPHIRRAVTISNLFNLKEIERQTFQTALDSMSHAVVLIDGAGGIVYANPAATALFARDGGVASVRGRLMVEDRVAQPAFDRALRLAGGDEALLGAQGIGLPVHGADGERLLVHVMPMRRGELQRGLRQRATAAVFIVSGAVGDTVPPLDAVSLAYDLTPAEGQIFDSIARGRTLADTAAALGVARSTAKTHLKRVFDKTGVRRQAELVALAARLALPV